MHLKEILAEAYVNAFHAPDKRKIVDEVWELLQQSYKSIGGLKGRCFGSKEEMIREVPMWKAVRRGGKIVACLLYKDKNGRKIVAIATDGSVEGKNEIIKLMGAELTRERSYIEVSGPAERMLMRHYPDLYDKYKIPVEKVKKILGDRDKIDTVGDDVYRYARIIGGKHREEKVMLGTPGKKIVPK